MKTRKIENRLAYLAALIVLVGVAGAAGSAFAADLDESAVVAVAMSPDGREDTIADAKKAMAEAAEAAAAALKAETAFDLDNQLTSISDTLIAAAD